MNVRFSPPDITEKEIESVVGVLKSGWLTTGPKTKEFEVKISEYCGTKKAVALNSQTACAETALRILGVKEGDEVITSAYTYSASASIIYHLGAKIVFCDTQKDSLEMDYDKLETLITEKTKAIIPVDLAGIVCDYDRIYKIVEKKKDLFKPESDLQEALGRIAIMADTAHSFGAVRDGKRTGAIADFSSFSFHAVKNLTTGEGGALTWKSIEGISDDEIYRRAQLISLHGQNKDALSKTKLGAWEYDIIEPLYKCNLTDIASAIGVVQLERYDQLLEIRKSIIERFNDGLKDTGVKVLPHYTENQSSSGHLYIVRISGINETQRNQIIEKMAERGIACNVHYKPLPMMTAYKNLGFDIKDYPNAYDNYVNSISLPLHTLLTDEEVSYVIENFKDIIKNY